VLLVHDIADPFLEIAKMAKYANFSRLCWVLFAIFSIMFLATRLWIYPVYILKSTLFEKNSIVPTFPAQYFFNGMLLLLLVLHMFWTYLLFKAIYKAAFSNKLEDVRSSSETCSCDSSDENLAATNGDGKLKRNANKTND
jgi:ceramide synthetase